MKKLSLTYLIALVVTIGNIYGQGDLFISDLNGFHLSGQISSTKESTLIGISPAYSMNDKFTFGLTLGFEESKSFDFSSTAIRPYIGFMALRQGVKESPINL